MFVNGPPKEAADRHFAKCVDFDKKLVKKSALTDLDGKNEILSHTPP